MPWGRGLGPVAPVDWAGFDVAAQLHGAAASAHGLRGLNVLAVVGCVCCCRTGGPAGMPWQGGWRPCWPVSVALSCALTCAGTTTCHCNELRGTALLGAKKLAACRMTTGWSSGAWTRPAVTEDHGDTSSCPSDGAHNLVDWASLRPVAQSNVTNLRPGSRKPTSNACLQAMLLLKCASVPARDTLVRERYGGDLSPCCRGAGAAHTTGSFAHTVMISTWSAEA